MIFQYFLLKNLQNKDAKSRNKKGAWEKSNSDIPT